MLVLDVSSLVRWTGPPVGITRVEHALARAARERPGTVLAVWDKQAQVFRFLNPTWTDALLGWQAALDVQDPRQSPFSRHRLFAALERIRLRHPGLGKLAERAQDALLALRPHGHRLRDASGNRIAYLPPDMALAGRITLGPADTVLSAGSDWFHLDAASLAAAKARHGFRYACLCYDLIPITHPHFYRPEDVALVTRHWRATLPVADRVIVNSRAIAADVAAFCQAEAIATPDLAILPLGYDVPPVVTAALPGPLRPGRYTLFVSTIEPRKGHAMLLRVWRRLLGSGLPQREDFRLVFVGRPGWMVEDVLADLAGGVERVHHLQGIDDAALTRLYADAAFVVYPSHYEGFGLPVIEAFARGKPVLAATGGALPETVGAAYPCLDPGDETAWEAALAAWIVGPPSAISAAPPVDWPTAAHAILARAEED